MVRIDDLAETALRGDPLAARSLAQDWLAANPDITASAAPITHDTDLRAVCAAIVELFAIRLNQQAPAWTGSVGSVKSPTFLLRSTSTMPRLRETCRAESPEPLRRRGIYAPANYLSFV